MKQELSKFTHIWPRVKYISKRLTLAFIASVCFSTNINAWTNLLFRYNQAENGNGNWNWENSDSYNFKKDSNDGNSFHFDIYPETFNGQDHINWRIFVNNDGGKQIYPASSDAVNSFGTTLSNSGSDYYFNSDYTDWSWRLNKPSYDFTKIRITAIYSDDNGWKWHITVDCYTNITLSKSIVTYVTPAPLNFANESGFKAYTATDLNNGNALLTEITNPEANTSVLLKGIAETYELKVAASGTTVSQNALIAGTGAAVASEEGNYKNYILSNGAFYLAGGKNIPANKAYLRLTKTSNNAMPQLIFADEPNVATDIWVIEQETTDNRCYNLQGMRVKTPLQRKQWPAFYITGGKKYIVK